MRSQQREPVPASIALAVMAGVIALSVCGSGTAAFAQTGSLEHSPAELVKKYLALDLKGARLDSLSFDALRPYTEWKEEPAWGRVVVVRGFTVAEHHRDWDIVDRLEVVIPVTFQVIGSVYLETAGFVPEAGVEDVRVRVKAVKNRWRIVEPVLPPHVGHKRTLNFVREALVKESEPEKRARLEALLEELRKAK